MTYVELSIKNKSAGAYELGTLAIGIASGHVERTGSEEVFYSVIYPGLFPLYKHAAVEDGRRGFAFLGTLSALLWP